MDSTVFVASAARFIRVGLGVVVDVEAIEMDRFLDLALAAPKLVEGSKNARTRVSFCFQKIKDK